MSSHNISSSEGLAREKKQPAPEQVLALPESYGKTEAALLPRDPNWMFIYWDITEDTKNYIRGAHGADVFVKSKSVVRVYNVAMPGEKYFDLPVMLDARSWYIAVPESGKSYYCELGLILPDGRFVGLVKTNTVNLPSGTVSDVADEKWMTVSGDFEKL